MGSAKKSTWIGGTVFVAVAIMALAWFLAISPTMAAAAELRAQTEQTEDQNELLELQLVTLQADFAKLPEYKAQLAALQSQIPTDAKLAAYLRELEAIATAHEVTLTTITPSTPQTVTVAAPAVEPTVPAEGSESSETQADTAVVDPAAAAPAPSVGLTAIPFSITAIGTYDNTTAFLYDLQNATPRLFLVSGFTGTSQKAAEASAGKPAVADGDQELIITGYAYVLPDPNAVPPVVDPAAPPAPMPAPVPGKNPLLPLGGN